MGLDRDVKGVLPPYFRPVSLTNRNDFCASILGENWVICQGFDLYQNRSSVSSLPSNAVVLYGARIRSVRAMAGRGRSGLRRHNNYITSQRNHLTNIRLPGIWLNNLDLAENKSHC